MSLRLPVSRQRLIDFQPDPVLFSLRGVIAVKHNITGDFSAFREKAGVREKASADISPAACHI